jgi:hypothetical protein
MAAAMIDYPELLKGLPAGVWVAISENTNQVIAYSAEIQTVIERAHEHGEDEPLIVRVPDQAGMLFL